MIAVGVTAHPHRFIGVMRTLAKPAFQPGAGAATSGDTGPEQHENESLHTRRLFKPRLDANAHKFLPQCHQQSSRKMRGAGSGTRPTWGWGCRPLPQAVCTITWKRTLLSNPSASGREAGSLHYAWIRINLCSRKVMLLRTSFPGWRLRLINSSTINSRSLPGGPSALARRLQRRRGLSRWQKAGRRIAVQYPW